MNKNFLNVMLLAVVFILTGARTLFAGDENLDEATKARVQKADQGPSSIDVSKYPQKLQDIYTDVFSQKCVQCHHLSRPINSDYALPSEWDAYVKKMMHKPGSGINNGEARKIIDFLIYDSSIRKKDIIDAKLAKATADEKVAAQAKIKEIQDKYAE